MFCVKSHIEGADTSPYRVCKERTPPRTEGLPLGLVEEQEHHLPAQEEGRLREGEDLRLLGCDVMVVYAWPHGPLVQTLTHE